MNEHRKHVLSVMAAAMVFCAPLSVMTASAANEKMSYIFASGLDLTADGYVRYGGEVVSGKLGVEPELPIGDVDSSGDISVEDASLILNASVCLTIGMDKQKVWEQLLPDTQADVEYLNTIADVNEDGVINVDDASLILKYSSMQLFDADIYPLGFSYYYADANGKLEKGFIEEDGTTYYAGENYKLLTGWNTINGERYYFNDEAELQKECWISTGSNQYYVDIQGIRLTGWQTIDGDTYYLGNTGMKQTGLVEVDGNTYWLGTDGVLTSGWQEFDGTRYYFFPENDCMATGWQVIDGEEYYFGEDGKMAVGWQDLDGVRYYFSENGSMVSGWQTIGGDTYCFDETGMMLTGWYYQGDDTYYLDENGVMATGYVTMDGVTYEFSSDGVLIGTYSEAEGDIDFLLNTAQLSPRRQITVYNRQVDPVKIDFTIKLSDADIAIIEQFAAEHFEADDTLAEKLYKTHQWIHYNVDYAYAGEKWNEIVNLSYVDAIFNHKKGQCVQYNGAMASVLAYYGFDVYMVRGWTSPGTQHYWTEVNLNGKTYMVECGNSGKNGDWWQYFFDEIE